VGVAKHKPPPFAFAESGKISSRRTGVQPVKRHRREPGQTRDTRVHTGTCAVSSFMNLGCDFQRSRIVKSSQVKSSKQVKLLAAGAHSIDLTLARSDRLQDDK